jgi:hypothetical protein
MDIRRPTLGSLLVLALMTLASAGTGGRPAGEGVRLVGGTPQERLLADWALERYRAAGLELPPVEIHFHRDPARCRGNSGFYGSGRLDVCSVDNTVAYSRKVVVHELAHAWSEANLTVGDRERFLNLRGLQSWNSWEGPWGLRGFEQAAEIITWGVTGGAGTVLVPSDDAPEQLRSAYELLTGRPPLEAATRPVVT